MAQLFFKKHLQEAIRAGRKRTTIRRWPRAMLGAGGRAWSPGLGFLAIDAVEAVDLQKLTDADAIADGFETAAELRGVLETLYPEHATDGKHWFRVFFQTPEAKAPKADAQGSLF
ncbi:MAG TPA: ASCH domain-containing protein [Tepidisphaeraceae bacterium]|jgi:hypothetical protein|nr:ASCH domain-containing protein [Tepidisphaeraceae bacterium]